MVPHVSVKWRYFSAHPAHLHSLSHTSIHSPFPPSLYKDEQDELEEERKGEEEKEEKEKKTGRSGTLPSIKCIKLFISISISIFRELKKNSLIFLKSSLNPNS
jgi:hypothetical protein